MQGPKGMLGMLGASRLNSMSLSGLQRGGAVGFSDLFDITASNLTLSSPFSGSGTNNSPSELIDAGRGTYSRTTGKWVYEAVLEDRDTTSPVMAGFSLANIQTTFNPANQPGSAVVATLAGPVVSEGNTLADLGDMRPGPKRLQFAIDLDTGMLWVRADQGPWNASGTANPATASGGVYIGDSLHNKPLYVYAAGYDDGAFMDIYTSGSTMLLPIPANFLPWNG